VEYINIALVAIRSIVITLLAIAATTIVIYTLANKVFSIYIRLKSLILCAAFSLLISFILPHIITNFTGLAGTIFFLAVFAIIFAYFVANYDAASEPKPADAIPPLEPPRFTFALQPDSLAENNIVLASSNEACAKDQDEPTAADNNLKQDLTPEPTLTAIADKIEESAFVLTNNIPEASDSFISMVFQSAANNDSDYQSEDADDDLPYSDIEEDTATDKYITTGPEESAPSSIYEPSLEAEDSESADESHIHTFQLALTVLPFTAISAAELTAEPGEDESVAELTTELTEEEPVAELTTELTEEEPVADLTTEPTEEEPVADLTTEPTEEEPVADLTTEPIDEETATELLAEPAEEGSVAELTTELTEEEPVADLTTEPIDEETATEFLAEPEEEESTNLTTEPTEEPVADLTTEPIDEETATEFLAEPEEEESTDLTVEPTEEEPVADLTTETIDEETATELIAEPTEEESISELADEASEEEPDTLVATPDSLITTPELEPQIISAVITAQFDTDSDIESSSATKEYNDSALEAAAAVSETLPEYQEDIVNSDMLDEQEPVSDSLEDLLDFAFMQKENQRYSYALDTFRHAFRLYRDSDAGPNLAIEIAALLKNKGAYDEAITLLSNIRSLPGIEHNQSIDQEIVNTIAYLRIVKNILLERRVGLIPFSQIPTTIAQEIDSEFHDWRNLA